MKCSKCDNDLIELNYFGIENPIYVCANISCPQYHSFIKSYSIPNMTAIKYDQGKLRYDLIPTDSLKELAKVFTHGAEKYDDRNWEKGIEWGRIYGAIQRHLNAFWSGEEINEEDAGLSHLAQAAWGCLVLESYRLRKIGIDTREKNGTNNSE